jgi:hypothetical protein
MYSTNKRIRFFVGLLYMITVFAVIISLAPFPLVVPIGIICTILTDECSTITKIVAICIYFTIILTGIAFLLYEEKHKCNHNFTPFI